MQQKADLRDSALYIHIPFCDHKCIYCDFYSIITKDNIEAFLTALKNEMKYYSEKYSGERIISSIFFGGGTPSLMKPEYLGEIISSINEYFNVTGNVEITMETNPGTVGKEKLKAFKSIGINRVSVGIQSFHEDELKFLTRIHDKETAIRTVYNAAEIGFDNISIDLIFNLPKQTREKWLSNLQTAASLPIKHLSAYSLILERGTILNKMVIDGKVIMQDEDYDADLYELTIDFLTANGFLQYEVSNFTKQGYECRHNNAYWRYKDYIGLGPSAHSFANGKRWWNFSSLKYYISEIQKNKHATASSEDLDRAQMFDEYVMLALRSKGLDTADFEKRFGDDWIKEKDKYLQKLQENKFIKYDGNFIRLTKSGYAICDEILAKLL